VEIAIEKKPVKKEPVKKEPAKPVVKADDMLAKLQEEARQEALKNKSVTKPNTNDALNKMQQELLNEDKAAGERSASAASAGVVNEFKAKIQAKIRSNVNKTLCGNGNPELKFEIGLIPTGELSGSPKLVKSSGNAACDDAVERAIRASEPLPLPQDASLFSQFRNLKLTFKPNES
jgi:colicin import membrane protein